MQKDLEKFSAMLKSADSKTESADSSRRNHAPSLSDRSNSIKELREEQMKIEEKEHCIAEQNLDTELNAIQDKKVTSKNLHEFLTNYFPNNNEALILAKGYLQEYEILNRIVTESKLKKYIFLNLNKESYISSEEGAIILKEKLITSGKSEKEILKTLIATYENEPELNSFVENWRNFLELWEFAQTKSPADRKAIETIITTADFTADNSFDLALAKIQNSKDISIETKLDIQRRFKTTGINTVNAFDRTLKNEKQYKKDIEKQIQTRNTDIENLTDEIDNLSAELKNLPPNDPKRKEIQKQIEQKSEILKIYEQEVSELNEAKPKNIQFQLRNNLLAILNSDGSRSVKMLNENFTIQLPKNSFLMGLKNLRSINVAFPFMALRLQQMDDEIFAPNLQNGEIPDKNQRKMGHLILSELGYNDNKILSENEIAQLKNDLSVLTDKVNTSKTGRENLIELGIWDIANAEVDIAKFQKVLQFIRENRENNLDFDGLKKYLKSL